MVRDQNLFPAFRQVKEDMAKTRQFREMDNRVPINPVKENRAKVRRLQATDSLVLTNLPRYQITRSVRNSKAKAQRFQSTDNHVLVSLLPHQRIDNTPSRTNQMLD